MTEMFETKRTCKICGQEVPQEQISEHRKQHIEKGDVWSAPCKLSGQPSVQMVRSLFTQRDRKVRNARGVCLLREHYDACQVKDMLKNNWMCWRDGILFGS